MTQPSNSAAIAIVGAGSWGTALAILIARNGYNVHLLGNEPEISQQMREQRCNQKYLADIPFPDLIHIHDALANALTATQDILLVVPSHAFSEVLTQIKPHATPQLRIAFATKGLLPKTNALLHTAISDAFPKTPMAVISGPSFAREVALGMPTAVTLASNHAAFTEDLQQLLVNQHFTLDHSADITGVELGGVVKNILAIATGMLDGLGFGANARAALMTRGLSEITRLGIALGAEAHTFTGLSGMGDLILTCTDNQSRNRRFGVALGQGKSMQQAQQEIGQVVEGYYNTEQVYQLAQQHQIDLPIIQQIHAIMQQEITPTEAAQSLL